MPGAIVDSAGDAWVVQVDGQNIDINRTTASDSPALVGIGPRSRVDLSEVEALWASVAKPIAANRTVCKESSANGRSAKVQHRADAQWRSRPCRLPDNGGNTSTTAA